MSLFPFYMDMMMLNNLVIPGVKGDSYDDQLKRTCLLEDAFLYTV